MTININKWINEYRLYRAMVRFEWSSSDDDDDKGYYLLSSFIFLFTEFHMYPEQGWVLHIVSHLNLTTTMQGEEVTYLHLIQDETEVEKNWVSYRSLSKLSKLVSGRAGFWAQIYPTAVAKLLTAILHCYQKRFVSPDIVGTGFRVGRPGFSSWLHCPRAGWPWVSHFASLDLSLSACLKEWWWCSYEGWDWLLFPMGIALHRWKERPQELRC